MPTLINALAQYIGDGVYAHFDGENIWLETERYTPHLGGEIVQLHRIAINRDNWRKLLRFKQKQVGDAW
jgi:hypothetical protein